MRPDEGRGHRRAGDLHPGRRPRDVATIAAADQIREHQARHDRLPREPNRRYTVVSGGQMIC